MIPTWRNILLPSDQEGSAFGQQATRILALVYLMLAQHMLVEVNDIQTVGGCKANLQISTDLFILASTTVDGY